MGSIVKSGSAPISGVLSPGEKLRDRGLRRPGLRCHAGQRLHLRHLAAGRGINLHVFTTGRGTPYGLAEVPVIKVPRAATWRGRWHDLMDVNAGRIADGEATIEEVGWELFR
jgi:galactarate dehydratase